jgi:hypothetical protein
MKIRNVIGFFVIALVVVSCYYDKFEEIHPNFPGVKVSCDTSHAVTYTNDIAPYFATNCGTGNSCHNKTAAYPMNNQAATKSLAQNSNKLMNALNWVYGGIDNMPQSTGSKLPPCDILMVQRWVNAGCP